MLLYNITCSTVKAYSCPNSPISKHIQQTRLQKQWSTTAKHNTKTKHSINFTKSETLTYIQYYRPHIIREATEITKHIKDNCEDRYKRRDIQYPLSIQTFFIISLLVSILSTGGTG
jgi:hypothetical protein